jgi:hypothetical protein
VAVSSLTACVILSALWVRSYRTEDVVFGWLGFPGFLQINSNSGCLKLIANLEHRDWEWLYNSYPPEANQSRWVLNLEQNPNFGWWLDIHVPHSFAASIAASIAAATWFGWPNRFSLRTLLLVTTLAAAMFGIVASGL